MFTRSHTIVLNAVSVKNSVHLFLCIEIDHKKANVILFAYPFFLIRFYFELIKHLESNLAHHYIVRLIVHLFNNLRTLFFSIVRTK